MISSLASKGQDFQFHFIKWLKNGHPTLRTCHFEASEDIIPQEPYIEKLGGVATLPPSFPLSGIIAIYVLKMKFSYYFAHDSK